jgi:hypothetical protein
MTAKTEKRHERRRAERTASAKAQRLWYDAAGWATMKHRNGYALTARDRELLGLPALPVKQ